MSKKLIIAIIAIVIAVAIPVTLLVVLGGNNDGNADGKNPNLENLTPAEQYVSLEGTALHDIVNVFLAEGSGSGEEDSFEFATSAEVSIIPSDALMSMLGVEGLEWFQQVSLTADVMQYGNLIQVAMGLGLNGKNIVGFDMINNPLSGISYMGIPALSKYYMKTQNPVTSGASFEMGELKDLLTALPTMRESLNTYIDLAMAKMTNIERGTEAVKVGSTTENTTVLTNYITEKVAVEIVKAVLTEAKNDSKLEALLPSNVDLDAEIDNILATLPNSPPDNKSEAIVLKVYLNENGEVIGRAIDMMDRTRFFFVSIADGNATKLGFVAEGKGLTLEIASNSIVLLTEEDGETAELASLTYSGDNKNGAAALKVTSADTGMQVSFNLDWKTSGGKTVITVSIKSGLQSVDVATITCTGDDTNGTMEIKLSDGIESLIFGTTEIDPSLLISWGNSGNKMDLFMMGEKMVSFVLSVTEKTPTEIKAPSNALDMSNPNAMQTFVNSIKMNTLRQNLINAGMPAYYADAFINGFASGFAGALG